ncbi:neuroendocrine convertase 1-like [Anneissia japonica]|uniref:neuroendocrine convertase 1-like n=1 Tax=Anneissia japonica TaxID=1529436 RepID=UPI00142596E7|nr:neuroendocrine convertase 1-like [Anneissia japonica]
MLSALVFLAVASTSFTEVTTLLDHAPEEVEFTNEFAVQVHGGPEVVRNIARDLGYDMIGKIGDLDDYYLLQHHEIPSRSIRSAFHVTKRLADDDRVNWFEQQRSIVRQKRDYVSGPAQMFNDEYWPQQWYLFDQRKTTDVPKTDLHVMPVWKKNVTGAGVVVTIIDDGLEKNHSDLSRNYDPKASWDYNDNDEDPSPRATTTNENAHGTRCAGEVSMQANNLICGVGIAFNAKIGGIRMLDGKVTDALEAAAFSHALGHIDIFSASWGPSDDGKTVEGPGNLASKAIQKGIRVGRDGKGVLYVWASGNGGRNNDNCNCDGYADSIYTISISSASSDGQLTWYGERCPSTLASTFSSDFTNSQQVITTDLDDTCTTQHSGTSASAPMAAGILALALEVNPNLTWRDIQHIIVWTSEYAPLESNDGWLTNGIGLKVNSNFGFGLLNAHAIVEMADPSVWQSVPPKRICESGPDKSKWEHRIFSKLNKLSMVINTDGCAGSESEVTVLEHVQVILTLNYTRRGNLKITLTSPEGTSTNLLEPRETDESREGFRNWAFMSVHTWGENPAANGGQWELSIEDKGSSEDNSGALISWQLVLHGMNQQPEFQKGGRQYTNNYNQVKNEKRYKSRSRLRDFESSTDEQNIYDAINWARDFLSYSGYRDKSRY